MPPQRLQHFVPAHDGVDLDVAAVKRRVGDDGSPFSLLLLSLLSLLLWLLLLLLLLLLLSSWL